MRVLVLAVLGILTIGTVLIMQDDSSETITPAEVHALMESDSAYLLLDVRTGEEFDGPSGHLRGAILIPVQHLKERLSELTPHTHKTIIAICRSGNRSGYATSFLRDRGFRTLNMVGGMVRWNNEKRPTVQTEHP